MQEFEQREFEDTLELKDIIRLLKKYKGIIAFSTILILFIAAYITFSMVPSYQASTLILIEEEQQDQFFEFDFGTGDNYLNDQIQILTSRSLIENVIDSLWRSPLRNNLYAINTRTYSAKTAPVNELLKKIFSLGLYNKKEHVPIQTGGLVPDSLMRRFSQSMLARLEVSLKRETNAISITYSSPDPGEAAFISNLIVQIYIANDHNWKSTEIVELKSFLSEQLSFITDDLTEAEDKLKEFQETQEVYSVDGNSEILLEELTKYESSYYAALAEVNVYQKQLEQVTKLLSDSEKELVANVLNTADPRIKELRSQLAAAEAQKVYLLVDASMGENSPAVVEVQTKINNLQLEIKEEAEALLISGIPHENPLSFPQELQDRLIELNSQIIQYQSRADEFGMMVERLKGQVVDLPEKTVTLARLIRNKKVKEELFLLLSQKLEETRITEASQSKQIRIIDRAIPPNSAKKPNKKLNLLLGLVLGLGAGMGVAFLLEYSDNTIRSIDSIQKFGVSVIGVIPKIGENYRRKRKGGSKKNKEITSKAKRRKSSSRGNPHFTDRLVSHLDPKNPVSESYRSIRTNITYSKPDSEISSLLVTSPSAGEGKSTTVVNIAITFAQLGKRTILVDTDLRKPVLHKIFSVDREPGISNYIGDSKKYSFENIINETEIENLHMITSGKLFPNPSELIGSHRMKELISVLKEKYDIVLFDSPPVMPVTDSRMLSKETDGLLLIVKSGQTETMALERTVSLLKSVNAPLIGCVLNGFSHRDSYYYSDYQYYYYYEYYYDSGEEE